MEESLDIWIMRCLDNIISHEESTFTECFRLLCLLIDKYQFQSPRKRTIISTFLQSLPHTLQEKIDSLDDAIAFK